MDVGEAAWAKLVAVGVAIEGGPGGRDGGERRNGFSVVTKSSSSDADQKFPRCQSCGPCTVGGSRASQTRFQVLVGKPQPRRCGADASPNCVIGLQDVASSSRCGVELNESSSNLHWLAKASVGIFFSFFYAWLVTCSLHSLLFHLETQHTGVRSIQEVQSWAADCVWVPLKGGSEDMSHMTSKTCTFCEVGDSNVNVNESLKRILETWFLDGSRPISSVSVR